MPQTPNLENESTPMSYIDWVQSSNLTITSEHKLFNLYNQYVSQWYTDKGIQSDLRKQKVVDIYKNLLREITIHYASPEEKRFLLNID